MKKGVAISPGIVIARAFRPDEVRRLREQSPAHPHNAESELLALEVACEHVGQELDKIADRLAEELDDNAANIFRAHRLLLRDPGLLEKVRDRIRHSSQDAAHALIQTQDEYAQLFTRIPDNYLRERMADIRDVIGRLVNYLTLEESAKQLADQEPVVLVAPEILPSQAVMFGRLPVAGIVTEAGGSTGHAAILARSMGLPTVSGIKDLLAEVHTGDLLIVDGREGIVVVNPGREVESAYRKMQREYVDLRHQLVENRDLPGITADGVPIELLANVNNVLDAATAVGVGASGVGLFRSEFIFLTHASVPNEEEQFAAYRSIVEASPFRRVTIRTLDLGGDKQVPYFGQHREANPVMGWRSIRLMSEYPDFFQTQLRAIMRIMPLGQVSVLFPMVSTVEEVERLRRLIEKTRMSLERDGIPAPYHIPFGVMIEVPAAAICIDHILDLVDFISIGSNDLIQYMMAADRDNPKVAHLCEPFHPAIFRILHEVITICVRRGKPVTLCGEMAARPTCLLPLLGMGLRRFSMSPAFVPTAKELVRAVTLADAYQAAEQIIRMRTLAEVREFLRKRVRQLCPKVANIDSM
jgi:phosphoenolpyruvate-protein phosphotransferase (PTS system enzyme I)